MTQHVRNVETLTEDQNEQFRRVHLAELKSSSNHTESSKTGAVLKNKIKNRARRSSWTLEAHRTRSAARKIAEQQNSGKLNESVVKGVEG